MHTGDVVNLFEGKGRNRSQTTKRGAVLSALGRGWTRVVSIAVAVAEVVRETRELEKRLLNQRGYRRFNDR